ncbi:MAG TPA: carboxypeptidase regulatory-like domain-containing protein [Vicinamibacteria bacterium]
MRRVRLAVCVAVVCSLALAASPSLAQTIRGTLTGTVTDTTGAVVPGITVTVTNAATGISSSAVTNQQGAYTIPLLPPGTYQATVEQTGFKKYLRDGIVVQIAQTTRLDIPLQVGAMSEAVEVVGETPLVRSTTAELGHVIEMKQIQGLPLNGRFFEHLITLTPGAMPVYSRGDSAENASAAGARVATAHTINGLPWSGNNYLLDGVVNNEMQNAYINITPPLEAIQEFKVQTNNPTAEFGVFGGGAVNLSIRSGTNEFHGSAFDYIRDDSLNSRSYFAQTKAPYNSHQFGGTFGGPILKNKAFFFGDYQGLRLDQGRTQVLSVPTALMRQGIFTEVPDQIFDPLTGQAFAGNIIPSSQINPITRRVADLYPLPNLPGLANNYVENNVVKQTVNAGDARVDYRFNEQSSLFARFSMAKRHYDEPAPGNIFMGANNADNNNYNAVVGYTHTLASNKFYEARVGYNRYWVHQFAEDFGIDENNQLGIPNGNLAAFPESSGIASFRPSGFSNTGSPGTTNAIRVGTTYHITNDFSWIKDKHAFKTGADVRVVSGAVSNPQTQPQGRFNFDRNYTSRAGASGTGYSFASFLLGYPTSIQRDVVDTWPLIHRNFVGLFVQDDYRVSRKLSLQLGLRWDLMTPPVQGDNRQSNFSPADGLIHLASADNRGPDRKTQWGYFAPRLGAAYTPDNGKTAIRAAFGMSYFADNFGASGGTSERNYPFFLQYDQTFPQFSPTRSVSEGLPTFTSVPLAPTLTPPPGFAVFYIPVDFHEDTAKMWNVGVQRELGWNTMIDVSYVGTRGTHIFRSFNVNVPMPGPGAVQQRRPYFSIAPNITTINQRDGGGSTWYDAVQVKLDKRFSHGLQALVSYTYSKTKDNISSTSLHPSLQLRLPATNKVLDIPHIFVASATYELPFARGSSGLAKTLAAGWSVSAITIFHSGDPLDIRVSASQLNTGTANWADETCDPMANAPRTVQQWFDKSCFADPAQFQFGNYKIGDARGPTIFNTDASAAKRFSIGKASAEVRIDVFNVFNRAHFANPGGAALGSGVANTGVTFGTAAFGTISATRLPPREAQLGIRLLF